VRFRTACAKSLLHKELALLIRYAVNRGIDAFPKTLSISQNEGFLYAQ
jgi:hypothetical protein